MDQVVALLNDNTIGKDGDMIQLTLLGTGESIGNHLEPIFKEQADNVFKSSEIQETTIFVNPVVGMRKYQHPRNGLESRKKIPTFYECTRIIQAIYDEEIRRMESERHHDRDILTKSIENMSKPIDLSRRGPYSDVGRNLKRMDTRLKLASGGTYAFYAGIERDQAINQALLPITDIQDHGKYENSKIDLVDVQFFSSL